MEHSHANMRNNGSSNGQNHNGAIAVTGGREMALEQIEQFFRSFDSSVYRVMAGGRNAVTEVRLAEFEKALDFRFPAPFREFTLSALGGLYIEVREEIWPRPAVSDERGWRDHYGLKIFGLCAPIPEWLDLREEIMGLPEEEGDLIPFMAVVGSDDRYCYDLDGTILRWSPDGTRQPEALEFADLVMRELRELETRRGMLVEKKRRGRPRKNP